MTDRIVDVTTGRDGRMAVVRGKADADYRLTLPLGGIPYRGEQTGHDCVDFSGEECRHVRENPNGEISRFIRQDAPKLRKRDRRRTWEEIREIALGEFAAERPNGTDHPDANGWTATPWRGENGATVRWNGEPMRRVNGTLEPIQRVYASRGGKSGSTGAAAKRRQRAVIEHAETTAERMQRLQGALSALARVNGTTDLRDA